MNNNKISPDQCKDTGLAITLVVLLVIWAKNSISLIAPATAVLVLTMVAPRLFAPLAWLWFGFSNRFGQIVFKIFLAIVFFLVLTPIGLVRKLSGNDVMRISEWQAGKGTSAFIKRDHWFTSDDLEKPF